MSAPGRAAEPEPAPPAPGRPEERGVPGRMRGLVSRVLRGGVALAAALLVVGLALLVARGPVALLTAPPPFSLGQLVAGLVAATPSAYLLLGFLVLVLTPVTRVVISVGLFASAGDRTFLALTLFVLAVLVSSVVLGVLA